MNTLKKLIKQKNTLLFFATCIALSSITLQCDSCDAAKEEVNTVAMNLEGAPEIKGSEVATLTLQKTAGATILGDVVFTITNPESFVTEGGKALTANMRLNEFLGKEAEEKMEDAKIELKVKASPKTIADNKNIILKIAVGNNTDTAAYVSEKDVVTWKAAPPTAAITVTVTPGIISPTILSSTIRIENPGTANIAYGDILVTLDIAASNLDHFKAKYGIGIEQDFLSFGGGTPVFLHNWLSVLGTTINATDSIAPGTAIEIIVTSTALVADGSKITFSVGKTGAPDLYSGGTKVITWQAESLKIALEVTPAHSLISNDTEQALTIKIEKKQGFITYEKILVNFENLGAFTVTKQDGSTWSNATPLNAMLGKNATDEIPNGIETFTIKVKATNATKNNDRNEVLGLSIAKSDGSVTYSTVPDVITWSYIEKEDISKQVTAVKKIHTAFKNSNLAEAFKNAIKVATHANTKQVFQSVLDKEIQNLTNQGEITESNVYDARNHVENLIEALRGLAHAFKKIGKPVGKAVEDSNIANLVSFRSNVTTEFNPKKIRNWQEDEAKAQKIGNTLHQLAGYLNALQEPQAPTP